jgi:hypothetical protein
MTQRLALARLSAGALAAGMTAGTMLATGTMDAAAQSMGQSQATVANEIGSPIEAPETVDPGQQVTVSVAGAAQGAMIELWGPVTETGGGERIAAVPLTGSAALVTAPPVPASYQLRYVGADGALRAQRAFEVAASPVMLEVPVEANAGATMQVRWRGPARAGDTLQIADPATGLALESTPVAGDPAAQNISQLIVPDHAGRLELRYVTLDGTVLRSIPFQARRIGG